MQEIKISFAPMEGVTTVTFRRIFREFFEGVDRFYTPFLAATQTRHFKNREKKEYLPYDPVLIPQVLTGKADQFLWAARTLADAGYAEVNLNLGCPATTVVTKKKGSGLLADPEALDLFLEEIFREQDLPRISVKTRIGFQDPGEAERLGKIYGKYPFCRVIIHPRVREDFYKNAPRMDAFENMKKSLSCPVCYNGDIRTPEDAEKIQKAFPDVEEIMIGRGLLADPALASRIKGGDTATPENLLAYVRALWDAYSEIFSGERDVLFKMKEIWFHLGQSFPGKERQMEKIRHCKTAAEYRQILSELL